LDRSFRYFFRLFVRNRRHITVPFVTVAFTKQAAQKVAPHPQTAWRPNRFALSSYNYRRDECNTVTILQTVERISVRRYMFHVTVHCCPYPMGLLMFTLHMRLPTATALHACVTPLSSIGQKPVNNHVRQARLTCICNMVVVVLLVSTSISDYRVPHPTRSM
jgi:hypothetical protein